MPGQSHGNHTHDEVSGGKLLATVFLNFIITAAEIIGGLLSNSLALLSDAIHNLGDTVSVFIAWAAFKISKRKSNERKTFGYRRIQILAALFNAVTLIAICLYLFYEAWLRFQNPEPIKGLLMFIVALIGLLANLVAVLLLHKDKARNINIKAAYLHLLGDTLSSVAVVIGGILIYFYEMYWIDPLITVLISAYIIKETYSVLRETIDILMQAAPKGINVEKLRRHIESIDGIENIHHIHLWQLDDKHLHFDCHLDLKEDLNISRIDEIRVNIEKFLIENFDITHVTIQPEFRSGHGSKLFCH
ncbi:MAG: cation diffusion facilitator family transporter [Bacteroidota bacterium]